MLFPRTVALDENAAGLLFVNIERMLGLFGIIRKYGCLYGETDITSALSGHYFRAVVNPTHVRK